ncbi:putative cell segregation machinery component [Scheffersomyces coipomensis]|uniref:putative cell segregation machinery component n=1 Tax=Scheffersomyces coipomensis TaxID=1788519 RepID=UPI00315C611C
MSSFDTKKSNILPNTYIPVLSNKVFINILSRLPKLSLVEFLQTWPKLINTQPHIDKENSHHNQNTYNQIVIKDGKELKRNLARLPKRKVIDKIIFQYWTKGLNLLQLSQLDCQLIVDRPNSFYWIKSTVKDSFNREVPISLDPQKFLNSLVQDLNSLYLTYIYICKHPSLPSVIIRVQLFDLQSINHTTNSITKQPHIVSHRAHFIAIPLNSPHIMHSVGNDIVTNLVLQAVERNLPHNPHNLLKLHTEENQTPIRSLESMHVLNGNSRFGNSLGIWTPYADGTADALPLQPVEKHKTLNGDEDEVNGGDNGDSLEMKRLKKIANLRFKGSSSGNFKSSKFYDDVNANPRKRRRLLEQENLDDDSNHADDNIIVNEFASIAPISFAEFIIQEKINDQDDSNISIKFNGTDIYAGLHELSVLTADKDKMILNPSQWYYKKFRIH